jgi:hypothetical protein
MILISHRGNIDQKIPALENTPVYIDRALNEGYNVEIDVWWNDGMWYLGQDKPVQKIDISYLKNKKLWCHAKNLPALEGLMSHNDIRFFWHQEDDVALTSDNYVWTYPGKKLISNSICVMPERYGIKKEHPSLLSCAGICSDIIGKYK